MTTPTPTESTAMTATPTILFVCVHNAGRSQMAAGYAQASKAADDVVDAEFTEVKDDKKA